MCKVKDEFVVDKYRILGFDEPIPFIPFHHLLLGGKKYDVINVYDCDDAIGIFDDGLSLLGKEVEFLTA